MSAMNRLPLMLLVCATLAWRAAAAETTTQSYVSVRADRMDYLREESCFVCEDNVVVMIGRITLTANKVAAYQDGKDSTDAEEFSRIVATGNVRVQMGDRMVRGQTGVWDRVSKTIRITGNPIASETGGRQISADTIVYDIVRDKISFEGRMQLRAVVTDDLKHDYRDFKGL